MAHHPEEPPAAALVSGRLRLGSIEEQNHALGNHYAIEYTQLDPGAFRNKIDYMVGAGVVLYRECYGQRIYVQAALRSARFGLALQLACRGSRWWGEIAHPDRVPSLVPGEHVTIMALPPHDHLVMHLDYARLMEAVEHMRLGDQLMAALRQGRASPLLRAHAPALRQVCGQLQRLLADSVAGKAHLSASRFGELVLGAVLTVLDRNPPALRGLAPSAALFHRARRAFEDAETPPTITGLCLALRASPRTLEMAFQNTVGMSPLRFFINVRLNRARARLLALDPEEACVSEVAFALGFSELGRFAMRYKALFGETPSDTLRRRVTRPVAMPGLA